MGDWTLLLPHLSKTTDSVTLSWSELETIVGGLPPSATNHRAWWSGDRPHVRVWRSGGFEVTELRPGVEVTFERRRPGDQPARSEAPRHTASSAQPTSASFLLMSCGKQKHSRPAAARDLYTSELFRKQRAYAEASGKEWFILSAEHGLVRPEDWIAPYDRYLPDTPTAYRRAFGEWVAARLDLLVGPLAGEKVEVHAGATYVDAIRGPLDRKGATLVTPLAGMSLGQRLAWYLDASGEQPISGGAREAVDDFVRDLSDESAAQSVDVFLASNRSTLAAPGLYSWWVDERGAADLAHGLGHQVGPGLIYAGLAGATRWPSGRRSTNTLWSRIAGMHLGKTHEFSTFRRTLGSVLAAQRADAHIDEAALSSWMREHLRIVAIPYDDPATLGRLERDVLTALDPPFNLQGMRATPIRRTLSELRRPHSRR